MTAPGIRQRRVHTNGVDLHVTEAGEGVPVVLAHGFPELAYSWRHQIPVLAAAGHHVIAPDQRGYGRSERPEAVEAYDIHHLTDDLLGLLDEAGHDRAVFVGHDWGAMVVWQMALLHPDRVAGVCGMSVPFVPRGEHSPIERMRAVFADAFFYILYFQEPGVADADLGADPAETMTRMLAGLKTTEGEPSGIGLDARAADDDRGFVARLPAVERLPSWLSQPELDHYIAEFTRTGFTGALNWYRNFHRNWETTPQLQGARLTVPSAFITGADDPVNLLNPPSVMDEWADDHRGTTIIPDAGHWVQQERPAAVNEALLSFLADL